MTDHSIFAPSSGEQLIHCAGSVLMQAQFPDEGDSVASAEGTAAHWWGAEHLAEDGSRPLVGAVAPNGVTVTQGMADGAGVWIDAVEDILADAGTAAVVHVERRVDIKTVHDLCFGTPDTDIWVPWSKTLHVVDFKFGFELHEAPSHIQCVEYAEGRVVELIAADPTLTREDITVVITIVQPRAYHVLGTTRSWTCKATDLAPIIATLAMQAFVALEPDPPCVTGPGCTHCRGRHACLAFQAKGYAAAEYVNGATAVPLSGANLALELQTLEDALAAIKARLSGLQEQAFYELRHGKALPSYGIEHGRGGFDWTKPAKEVADMGDSMGVDLRKPLACITPNQAKKLIDDSVISAYAVKTPGAAKLVRIDNLAKQVFGQ
jgi:hypothetical protein